MNRTTSPDAVVTTNSDEITIDLLDLMYKVLASWKLIVCLSLAVALLMGVYSFVLATPMYEATSVIYVLGDNNSVIDMSKLNIGAALTADYIKVFDMWEVHEEVIYNLNLPYSYTAMKNNLSVVNDNDTRMLDITFTSPNPEEAAAVANEYAKVVSQYIADTMSTDKPSIMSVALVPTNPISPNKTRNVMLGFILGFAMAVGIVTVQYIMDDKYKTAEDVRKHTGMIVLAMIPREDDAEEMIASKKNKTAKKGGTNA